MGTVKGSGKEMNRVKRVLGGAAFVLLGASCANQSVSQQALVTEAFKSPVCGQHQPEPSVRAFSNVEQWQAFKPSLGGPAKGVDKVAESGFDTLVYVSLGQKPTGGYSLSLAETRGSIQEVQGNQVLEISLNVATPPEDAMVAMMLSQPCIGLLVKGAEPNHIKVLDENGSVLAETQAIN